MRSSRPGQSSTKPSNTMPKEMILLSNLPVSPHTKKVWEKYQQQKRSKAALLQQILIHCEGSGFNPQTAPLEWQGE
tara:strand:+ start:755 stop:982 length:228 start_codon:yes stop_codon:yes gene_type:complete